MSNQLNVPVVKQRFSLAITGASGVRYGLRLVEVLAKMGHHVDLLVSPSGFKVLALECGLSARQEQLIQVLPFSDALKERIRFHDCNNIASSLASGSALNKLSAGMIVPCSMGTLARIAHGISSNLIERHADVLIKEKKPLIIVPREAPLSSIHLENLLKLSQLGVQILPASPGFYHQPKSVEDLVDHVVGKVLDLLKIEHNLYQRWDHA